MVKHVGVKVKYTIKENDQDNTESMSWDDQDEMRVGLPEGQEPTKPDAGSFEYSGMDDQGPLTPPKEGGIMTTLMSSVFKAKQYNDQLLTKYITSKSPATKRSKTD